MNVRLLILLFTLGACTPRYAKEMVVPDQLESREIDSEEVFCNKFSNYAPDEYSLMRLVRVNFHIMRTSDGSSNFNRSQAREYVNELLFAANHKLSDNQPMSLPAGNNTPALPTKYRLVLWGDEASGSDGIYLHDDDSTAWFNKHARSGQYSLSDQSPFKYAVGLDSIINIYLIEHHWDSIKNNPDYYPSTSGVSYGRNIKLYGAYHNRYTDFTKNDGSTYNKGAWYYSGLLNHEIGHTLGLNHTWNADDGCDDTPKNPGCWGASDEPPCLPPTSNNMMDYNGCQCAITPCQLAKMHFNMWKHNSTQRKALIENWCDYSELNKVVIARNKEVVFDAGRDFGGDIEVREGATLTIRCMVSLPEGARIIVRPSGRLVIDGGVVTNRCGDQWEGVEIWTHEKTGLKGELVLANGGRLENVRLPEPETESEGS